MQSKLPNWYHTIFHTIICALYSALDTLFGVVFGCRESAALNQDLLQVIPRREAHDHQVHHRHHELERAHRQDGVRHGPAI